MLHIPGLYIIETAEKGRALYSAHDIAAGDIIEICPIIKIPEVQLSLIDQTIFYDYYFVWDEPGYAACIALGYGSLYNHRREANAEFTLDYTDDTIKFHAVENIAAGSELLIDYTGDGLRPADSLWFDPVD